MAEAVPRKDGTPPPGEYEGLLIQRIAVAHWWLRRAYRYEAQARRELRNWRPHPLAEFGLARMGHVKDPPNPHLPAPSELLSLIRYEGLVDRELARSLQQLERLQALRRAGQVEGAAKAPQGDGDAEKERAGEGESGRGGDGESESVRV